MTDRVDVLVVTLDHAMRDDDVQPAVDAICMVKHVEAVAMNVEEPFAVFRARAHLHRRMLDEVLSAVERTFEET